MRIPTIAALALPLLATPAAAAAAPTVHERFTVTFEAQQTTTWQQPRHNYLTDCYNTRFHEARGEERWTIRSRAPTPVLVVATTQNALFRIGTWSSTEIARRPHLRLSNVVARERSEADWAEPGRCGGTRSERALPQDDCGTRIPGLMTTFEIAMDRKFRFELGGDPPADGPMFVRCEMLYPEGVHDGILEDQAVPGQLDAFRNRARKTIRLSWSKTFQTDSAPNARPSSARTTVSWSFTFRRAARPTKKKPSKRVRRR